ncbi:asparagine and aspartate rich protein 1, putative [Plasmodium relictum]|uniref:RING-type E3 ubiquitin transferase n=1 Tax=Plasmodium relictum TaxID=85471 RepID=A0A1J1HFD3_PLARL|nr:asparagine and aspartate rich protein 1, putative [Plasmodium relictum]CRH02762.1 asparagine and aspartate rich protein 1, putative [Plasmodium relictum]
MHNVELEKVKSCNEKKEEVLSISRYLLKEYGDGKANKKDVIRNLRKRIYNHESFEDIYKKLKEIHGNSGICTRQWKEGSFAFKCYNCEGDPTCAICAKCFFASNHKNHIYRLTHTSGGCCDCGDTSWNIKGSCFDHRGINEENLIDKCILNSVVKNRIKEDLENLVGTLFKEIILKDGYFLSLVNADYIEYAFEFFKDLGITSYLFRQIICEVFTGAKIDFLINFHYCFYGGIQKSLYSLYLSLFVHPYFKQRFAFKLAKHYSLVVRVVDDRMYNDNNLNGLSVQVLTVPEIAYTLVINNFLNDLIKLIENFCVYNDLTKCVMHKNFLRSDIEIIIRICVDLKYLLYHNEVIKIILFNKYLIRKILNLLTLLHRMNSQVRYTKTHIIYEDLSSSYSITIENYLLRVFEPLSNFCKREHNANFRNLFLLYQLTIESICSLNLFPYNDDSGEQYTNKKKKSKKYLNKIKKEKANISINKDDKMNDNDNSVIDKNMTNNDISKKGEEKDNGDKNNNNNKNDESNKFKEEKKRKKFKHLRSLHSPLVRFFIMILNFDIVKRCIDDLYWYKYIYLKKAKENYNKLKCSNNNNDYNVNTSKCTNDSCRNNNTHFSEDSSNSLFIIKEYIKDFYSLEKYKMETINKRKILQQRYEEDGNKIKIKLFNYKPFLNYCDDKENTRISNYLKEHKNLEECYFKWIINSNNSKEKEKESNKIIFRRSIQEKKVKAKCKNIFIEKKVNNKNIEFNEFLEIKYDKEKHHIYLNPLYIDLYMRDVLEFLNLFKYKLLKYILFINVNILTFIYEIKYGYWVRNGPQMIFQVNEYENYLFFQNDLIGIQFSMIMMNILPLYENQRIKIDDDILKQFKKIYNENLNIDRVEDLEQSNDQLNLNNNEMDSNEKEIDSVNNNTEYIISKNQDTSSKNEVNTNAEEACYINKIEYIENHNELMENYRKMNEDIIIYDKKKVYSNDEDDDCLQLFFGNSSTNIVNDDKLNNFLSTKNKKKFDFISFYNFLSSYNESEKEPKLKGETKCNSSISADDKNVNNDIINNKLNIYNNNRIEEENNNYNNENTVNINNDDNNKVNNNNIMNNINNNDKNNNNIYNINNYDNKNNNINSIYNDNTNNENDYNNNNNDNSVKNMKNENSDTFNSSSYKKLEWNDYLKLFIDLEIKNPFVILYQLIFKNFRMNLNLRKLSDVYLEIQIHHIKMVYKIFNDIYSDKLNIDSRKINHVFYFQFFYDLIIRIFNELYYFESSNIPRKTSFTKYKERGKYHVKKIMIQLLASKDFQYFQLEDVFPKQFRHHPSFYELVNKYGYTTHMPRSNVNLIKLNKSSWFLYDAFWPISPYKDFQSANEKCIKEENSSYIGCSREDDKEYMSFSFRKIQNLLFYTFKNSCLVSILLTVFIINEEFQKKIELKNKNEIKTYKNEEDITSDQKSNNMVISQNNDTNNSHINSSHNLSNQSAFSDTSVLNDFDLYNLINQSSNNNNDDNNSQLNANNDSNSNNQLDPNNDHLNNNQNSINSNSIINPTNTNNENALSNNSGAISSNNTYIIVDQNGDNETLFAEILINRNPNNSINMEIVNVTDNHIDDDNTHRNYRHLNADGLSELIRSLINENNIINNVIDESFLNNNSNTSNNDALRNVEARNANNNISFDEYSSSDELNIIESENSNTVRINLFGRRNGLYDLNIISDTNEMTANPNNSNLNNTIDILIKIIKILSIVIGSTHPFKELKGFYYSNCKDYYDEDDELDSCMDYDSYSNSTEYEEEKEKYNKDTNETRNNNINIPREEMHNKKKDNVEIENEKEELKINNINNKYYSNLSKLNSDNYVNNNSSGLNDNKLYDKLKTSKGNSNFNEEGNFIFDNISLIKKIKSRKKINDSDSINKKDQGLIKEKDNRNINKKKKGFYVLNKISVHNFISCINNINANEDKCFIKVRNTIISRLKKIFSENFDCKNINNNNEFIEIAKKKQHDLLQNMKEQQIKFSKFLDEELLLDDENEVLNEEEEKKDAISEYEKLKEKNCICVLCKEGMSKNNLLAYICFASHTNLLKKIIKKNKISFPCKHPSIYTCGHFIHTNCLHNTKILKYRKLFSVKNEPTLYEFTCPLCRCIANCFIVYIPKRYISENDNYRIYECNEEEFIIDNSNKDLSELMKNCEYLEIDKKRKKKKKNNSNTLKNLEECEDISSKELCIDHRTDIKYHNNNNNEINAFFDNNSSRNHDFENKNVFTTNDNYFVNDLSHNKIINKDSKSNFENDNNLTNNFTNSSYKKEVKGKKKSNFNENDSFDNTSDFLYNNEDKSDYSQFTSSISCLSSSSSNCSVDSDIPQPFYFKYNHKKKKINKQKKLFPSNNNDLIINNMNNYKIYNFFDENKKNDDIFNLNFHNVINKSLLKNLLSYNNYEHNKKIILREIYLNENNIYDKLYNKKEKQLEESLYNLNCEETEKEKENVNIADEKEELSNLIEEKKKKGSELYLYKNTFNYLNKDFTFTYRNSNFFYRYKNGFLSYYVSVPLKYIKEIEFFMIQNKTYSYMGKNKHKKFYFSSIVDKDILEKNSNESNSNGDNNIILNYEIDKILLDYIKNNFNHEEINAENVIEKYKISNKNKRLTNSNNSEMNSKNENDLIEFLEQKDKKMKIDFETGIQENNKPKEFLLKSSEHYSNNKSGSDANDFDSVYSNLSKNGEVKDDLNNSCDCDNKKKKEKNNDNGNDNLDKSNNCDNYSYIDNTNNDNNKNVDSFSKFYNSSDEINNFLDELNSISLKEKKKLKYRKEKKSDISSNRIKFQYPYNKDNLKDHNISMKTWFSIDIYEGIISTNKNIYDIYIKTVHKKNFDSIFDMKALRQSIILLGGITEISWRIFHQDHTTFSTILHHSESYKKLIDFDYSTKVEDNDEDVDIKGIGVNDVLKIYRKLEIYPDFLFNNSNLGFINKKDLSFINKKDLILMNKKDYGKNKKEKNNKNSYFTSSETNNEFLLKKKRNNKSDVLNIKYWRNINTAVDMHKIYWILYNEILINIFYKNINYISCNNMIETLVRNLFLYKHELNIIKEEKISNLFNLQLWKNMYKIAFYYVYPYRFTFNKYKKFFDKIKKIHFLNKLAFIPLSVDVLKLFMNFFLNQLLCTPGSIQHFISISLIIISFQIMNEIFIKEISKSYVRFIFSENLHDQIKNFDNIFKYIYINIENSNYSINLKEDIKDSDQNIPEEKMQHFLSNYINNCDKKYLTFHEIFHIFIFENFVQEKNNGIFKKQEDKQIKINDISLLEENVVKNNFFENTEKISKDVLNNEVGEKINDQYSNSKKSFNDCNVINKMDPFSLFKKIQNLSYYFSDSEIYDLQNIISENKFLSCHENNTSNIINSSTNIKSYEKIRTKNQHTNENIKMYDEILEEEEEEEEGMYTKKKKLFVLYETMNKLIELKKFKIDTQKMMLLMCEVNDEYMKYVYYNGYLPINIYLSTNFLKYENYFKNYYSFLYNKKKNSKWGSFHVLYSEKVLNSMKKGSNHFIKNKNVMKRDYNFIINNSTYVNSTSEKKNEREDSFSSNFLDFKKEFHQKQNGKYDNMEYSSNDPIISEEKYQSKFYNSDCYKNEMNKDEEILKFVNKCDEKDNNVNRDGKLNNFRGKEKEKKYKINEKEEKVIVTGKQENMPKNGKVSNELNLFKYKLYNISHEEISDFYLMNDTHDTFLSILHDENLEYKNTNMLNLLKCKYENIPFTNHLFYAYNFYSILFKLKEIKQIHDKKEKNLDLCTDDFLLSSVDHKIYEKVENVNFSDISFNSNESIQVSEKENENHNNDENENFDESMTSSLGILNEILDVGELIKDMKKTKKWNKKSKRNKYADKFFINIFNRMLEKTKCKTSEDKPEIYSNSNNVNNQDLDSDKKKDQEEKKKKKLSSNLFVDPHDLKQIDISDHLDKNDNINKAKVRNIEDKNNLELKNNDNSNECEYDIYTSSENTHEFSNFLSYYDENNSTSDVDKSRTKKKNNLDNIFIKNSFSSSDDLLSNKSSKNMKEKYKTSNFSFLKFKDANKIQRYHMLLRKKGLSRLFFYNIRKLYNYVYNMHDFIPLYLIQNILLHFQRSYKNVNDFYYYDENDNFSKSSNEESEFEYTKYSKDFFNTEKWKKLYDKYKDRINNESTYDGKNKSNLNVSNKKDLDCETNSYNNDYINLSDYCNTWYSFDNEKNRVYIDPSKEKQKNNSTSNSYLNYNDNKMNYENLKSINKENEEDGLKNESNTNKNNIYGYNQNTKKDNLYKDYFYIEEKDNSKCCYSVNKKIKTKHNNYNSDSFMSCVSTNDDNKMNKNMNYNKIPKKEKKREGKYNNIKKERRNINIKDFEKRKKDILNIKKVFFIFYKYLKNNNFIDKKNSCKKLYKKFLKKYLKSANVYLQFVTYIIFSVYEYNSLAKKYLDYIHLYSDINKYNIFLHILNIDDQFDKIYVYQTMQLIFHPYFYLMYQLYKYLKIDASPVSLHDFYENLEQFISSNSLFQPSQNYFTLIKKHFKRKCVSCNKSPKKILICLYCGSTICLHESDDSVGPLSQTISKCVYHTTICGGDQCLYLCLNTSSVLFTSENRFDFMSGPYVDKNGDVDHHLKRGRNLYLSQHKLNKIFDVIINSAVDVEIYKQTLKSE